MSAQYIMTIENLTRLYDEKEVLSDIWLAFYPGAKIGVLGNNGSGKSTPRGWLSSFHYRAGYSCGSQ